MKARWIAIFSVPGYTGKMIAFSLILSNTEARAFSIFQQLLLPAGLTTHQMYTVLYLIPAALPFLWEAEVPDITLKLFFQGTNENNIP